MSHAEQLARGLCDEVFRQQAKSPLTVYRLYRPLHPTGSRGLLASSAVVFPSLAFLAARQRANMARARIKISNSPNSHEVVMSLFSREECLRRLRAQVEAGKPIIGGGAGTGISAKSAEAGGIDLLIIYNSGRFRMAGRGSMSGMMPYGDANAIVLEMAREVLPVARKTPVLAGVCGTDPFRIMKFFLREIQAVGFSGVQNFPTVGLIDGLFRQNLEETDMGYGLEVDMIREAHQIGLLTCPYVFNPDEAIAMTKAGADVLIPHMGLTTKGSIGAHTAMTLEEAAKRVQAIADAAKKVRPEILVLCHGGPISEPEDAQYILDHCQGIVGFFGASSIERLPTEVAISGCVRKFKEMKFS